MNNYNPLPGKALHFREATPGHKHQLSRLEQQMAKQGYKLVSVNPHTNTFNKLKTPLGELLELPTRSAKEHAELIDVFKPSVISIDAGCEHAADILQLAHERNIPTIYRVSEQAIKNGKLRGGNYQAIQHSELLVTENAYANQLLEGTRLPTSVTRVAEDNLAGLGGTLKAREALSRSQRQQHTPVNLKELRVAAIMDEFTEQSYAPECQLLPLTPHNYLKELEDFQPQLLFIESAWRGKDELWGPKVGHKSQEVLGVIAWCKANAVPTVFWNKEDPVHFETFLNVAKEFDHVFTTDIDCVQRYKNKLGHNRVYFLPFAAQPLQFNPLETFTRKPGFSFAGAYYQKYPDRNRDLNSLISAISKTHPIDIYDRNYGKTDPAYQFPEEYRHLIVGTLAFSEIQKSYKGYNYAFNMNSVKQSQSMFARRVYELLASNTLTVSNYSKGIRTLFGDLVICTDNGDEASARLRALEQDSSRLRRVRLAGLRKALTQHTYAHRLRYVASKALGCSVAEAWPSVTLLAQCHSQAELDRTLATFERQSYPNKQLLIAHPPSVNVPHISGVLRIPLQAAHTTTVQSALPHAEWVAPINAAHHYGPHYLLDMLLATHYSPKHNTITKLAHYEANGQSATLHNDGAQYKPSPQWLPHASAHRTSSVAGTPLATLLPDTTDTQARPGAALCVDEFNFCALANDSPAVAPLVDDIGLDTGVDIAALIRLAELTYPEADSEGDHGIRADELHQEFAWVKDKPYSFSMSNGKLEVSSTLPDGKHDYVYSGYFHPKADISTSAQLNMHLEVSPGLNLQLVAVYFDATKKKISHQLGGANKNLSFTIPEGCAFIKFGLRLYASGTSEITKLHLHHKKLNDYQIISRGKHLVLTNHYPAYNDLYRNGFVHSRVEAYKKRGVEVDVFKLRPGEATQFYEFKDINVTTGSAAALDALLNQGGYQSVLIHFLDPDMWSVLEKHLLRVKVIVWIHGAEVQPLHRREYNYTSAEQLEKAKIESDKRVAFWQKVFTHQASNLSFVFVSQYFADEVIGDIGVPLDKSRYSIIHNPIDTEKFNYIPKDPEQRKKILSIRPFASRKYANDLSVKAILELKNEPFFNELEFLIIGDGVLFEETLEPIKDLPNVQIQRGFLTQDEIAKLHKEYGVFLVPTRMDAQGVSRDEAMASGLVAITNNVAAIPEFIDDNCGFLAPPEDYKTMAKAIIRLHLNRKTFDDLSRNAASRVSKQSKSEKIAEQELKVIYEAI